MIKIEKTEVVGWEAAIRGMRNPKNSWDKSDSSFCNSWISVGDRLPERPFHDWVLVKIEFNDGGNGVPHIAELINGKWHFQGLDSFDAEKTLGLKVTHWRPIEYTENHINKNDHDLMTRLAKGGPVHAKYRRMIAVYLDITAPLYWWKEFDTYAVGVVKNSCSTMHKIADKEFTLDDFSHEHLYNYGPDVTYFEAEGEHTFTLDGTDISVGGLSLLSLTIDVLNGYRDLFNSETNPSIKKRHWWQMIQLLPSSYNQRRTVMLNYEVLAGLYPMRKDHKLDEWQEFCKWIETLPYSELITGERVVTHG